MPASTGPRHSKNVMWGRAGIDIGATNISLPYVARNTFSVASCKYKSCVEKFKARILRDHGCKAIQYDPVCDLQEKFRPAIHEFDQIVATSQKMITASQILSIPILATTQNARALGALVAELNIPPPAADATNTKMLAPVADKTLFSMVTPEVDGVLAQAAQHATDQRLDAIIVGIESHICVTQTTLDLLARGHAVYVLADGVSSCNKEEVPIALRRLAAAGATVSSSESVLYEIMRDASIPEFRKIAGLVKESKGATSAALQALCKI